MSIRVSKRGIRATGSDANGLFIAMSSDATLLEWDKIKHGGESFQKMVKEAMAARGIAPDGEKPISARAQVIERLESKLLPMMDDFERRIIDPKPNLWGQLSFDVRTLITLSQPTWTPCADALPDSDLTVIVHSPESDEPIWLGYHDGHEWIDVSGAPYKEAVTHWMNFPEPPEVKA